MSTNYGQGGSWGQQPGQNPGGAHGGGWTPAGGTPGHSDWSNESTQVQGGYPQGSAPGSPISGGHGQGGYGSGAPGHGAPGYGGAAAGQQPPGYGPPGQGGSGYGQGPGGYGPGGMPPGGPHQPSGGGKGKLIGIIAGATALLLLLGGLLIWGLGRNKDKNIAVPSPTPVPVSTVTTPVAAPTTTPPRSATPSATPGSTKQGFGGQASPDAAAQAFLRAIGNTDARSACSIMAEGKLTFESSDALLDACVEVLGPKMQEEKDNLALLKSVKVSGATVNGDAATFENAKVDPNLFKSLIEKTKASKIDGKWYITDL